MTMPAPSCIIAFRNGSIGNTLVAVPALRAIKKRYPSCTLVVIVDSIGYQLLECCPWIDELIVYEKHGKDKGIVPYLKLIQKLRHLQPSHAVLFKRFFRNGLLAFLSGAKTRIGFSTQGKAPFLNRTIPYEDTVNIVELNMRLVELLDVHSSALNHEIWLSDNDRTSARQILQNFSINVYCIVHYGGQTTAPDYITIPQFSEILKSAIPPNKSVLFIGSGKKESAWAAEISRQIPNSVSACNLPLRTMAALIESAELYIGFNSGPAHIAAATGTPSLLIFRPDANADNEVRKWCPISPIVKPLLPPVHPSIDEWSHFLSEVKETALEVKARHSSIAEIK